MFFANLIIVFQLRFFTRRRRISHLQSKYFTSKIFHSFRRNKFHWKKHAISVLFSGADVHKGFSIIANKSGFKHNILHSYLA